MKLTGLLQRVERYFRRDLRLAFCPIDDVEYALQRDYPCKDRIADVLSWMRGAFEHD